MAKTTLLLTTLANLASILRACTIIAVTPKATVDGTSFTAHTDDAGGAPADIRLIRVPARDHPKHSKRAVYNLKSGYPRLVSTERGPGYEPKDGYNQKLSVPMGFIRQVEHTYAFLDQDYGMMNEVQLSIAESTCSAKTVGWPLDVSYGYNLLGISELSRIALERCDSARCAVDTMGALAVEYGFYSEDSGQPTAPGYADSAETLAISDRYGETWVFHVLTGAGNSSAVWAAQRVPDGHFTAVANGFIIRQMNLSDSDNFRASTNVQSFAQELHWWDPLEGPFDFTAAYSLGAQTPLPSLYVGRRIWRIFDTFAPSLQLDATLGFHATIPTYPFSIKPDRNLNLTDMFQILKDHYEGTLFDMTKGPGAGAFGSPVRYSGSPKGIFGGWERTIAMHRTVFSFVLQVTPIAARDTALNGIAWYGQGAPHGTVYIPFQCKQLHLPDSYGCGMQSEFDTKSSWSVFNFVNNWSQLRFDIINAHVQGVASKYQEQAIQSQFQLVQYLQTETSQSESDMLKDITKHNNEFADFVMEEWWTLAWKLVAMYADGYITTGENDDQQASPGYPAWWLNLTEYAGWPGNTWKPMAPEQVQLSTRAENTASNASVSWLQYTVCVLLGSVCGTVATIVIMKRYRSRHYYSLP